MTLPEEIKITAEKIFIEYRVNDNVSSNMEIAQKAFYASAKFHEIADYFVKHGTLDKV